MSNVTAAVPRKSLTAVECKFLKIGNRQLLEANNGRMASAALMDIVADWHASRSNVGFEEFAKAWITEGNARSTIATRLLMQLFGMNDPDPRKAA
ncbi:hypothetical protein ALQ08_00991 [Pseudomonas syringae pv. delphinii]|uniref:Uncharacterized protein n=1 Tax=Pseudomonas syringae pv. delphinii TaxID=192088 RepID=A0A0P9QD02_9PSED|nr:hypothetical protein [Pseudomonas syringae group genomosp. 3]KPX26052.1 Uncharacterized protein ALO72_03180 [Pseudomonas syringae pv. delphinii]RMP18257.1 hypothetical protein ALQ28_03889 [Pseudomonas syringae pv. delphinii]RMQ27809.1 hypothetical protein ALQ08_00991 [Pseudomonas syringae pv. delphinii]